MVQKTEPHNYKNEVSMTLKFSYHQHAQLILLCGKELLYNKHGHNELHLPLHQHYTKVGQQLDDDSLHKKGPKQGIAKDSKRTSCFINSTGVLISP